MIHNWTRHSGYHGQDFTAQQAGSYVLCVLPSGRELRVPKGDFETVYGLWPGYLAGQIQRVDEVTYYSKYVISILHQFFGEPASWRPDDGCDRALPSWPAGD